MTRRISARRRLLLERLLRLVEQPHVLNGDDRLVGEGLEQARCAWSVKGPGSAGGRLIAPMACLAHHRDDQSAPGVSAGHRGPGSSRSAVTSGSARSRDVGDCARAACARPAGPRGYTRRTTSLARADWVRCATRWQVSSPSNVGTRLHVGDIAQPNGARTIGSKHGLDVRRRARDHSEESRRRRLLLQRLLSVSLNSRTFSMAMTAWSAKVWSRAICVSEKCLGVERTTDDRANADCRHAEIGTARTPRAG